jgi:hypothetical protein
MIMDAGVRLPDLKEYRFAGTHDNVALNVARGAADAGGLMPDIAEKYKDQGIEVIARSPDLPEHVFAATKSMDQKTVDLLQNALVGMDIALAKGIKDSISNLQKFNDKDFDVLRKIMKQVGPELGNSRTVAEAQTPSPLGTIRRSRGGIMKVFVLVIAVAAVFCLCARRQSPRRDQRLCQRRYPRMRRSCHQGSSPW